MADKDATAQKAPAKARGRRRGMLKAYLSLLAAAAILLTALPTAIVGVVGMVPTLVTFIVDLTPGRYACRCVGALNFAGVVPFLRELWSGGNNLAAAVRIIGEPNSWLISYGAAAFGWALFLSLPGMIAAFSMLDAKRRVYALRDKQHRLVREWGKSIAGEQWRGLSREIAPDDADLDAEEGEQAAA